MVQTMLGKVVLITGSTSGMGRAAALALAGQGATVIVHGRDGGRAESVAEEIGEATGNPAVYFAAADLGDLRSVRELAADVGRRFHRLDVLVNNAGAVFGRRAVSTDGLEMHFQVNYLSHFLLTQLLLGKLRASSPARIVNVSASQHERGRMDFQDLQMSRRYTAQKAYAASKLAQILFTYELARRLGGTRVTCNACNPGLVKTDLGYDAGLLTSLSKRIVDLFGKSAEAGAEGIVYLACSPEADGVSGRYFEETRQEESSEMSYIPTTARRLWDVSLELCGMTEAEAARDPRS